MALQYSVAVRDGRWRRFPDETGKVYGKLTVLYRSDNRTKKDGRPEPNVFWVCQCECGNSAVVRAVSLRDGNTRSCGCLRIIAARAALSKPPGVAAINRAISIMMRNAVTRGLDWCLPIETVRALIFQNCWYCGSPPSNLSKSRNGNVLYNGIDRIDSKQGYLSENVVTCCSRCNNAKSDMPLEQFREWAFKLYHHTNTGVKS